MSKKLLGDRHIGEKSYESGQILSDEEFAASGLVESDVQDVPAPAVAPAEQATPAVPADADADVDAQATTEKTDVEKQQQEQSSQVGSEKGGSDGGASVEGDAKTDDSKELTVEHILTEQDLADNPELATQNLKVGDTVRLPAVERELTQADLDTDAALPEADRKLTGKAVGDKILVAAE